MHWNSREAEGDTGTSDLCVLKNKRAAAKLSKMMQWVIE